MANESVRKHVVLATNPAANQSQNQIATPLALYNPDGTQANTIKKQAAQADSTATTVAGLVTDFNALLAKLRLAGVIS
jgi:head fiber protein